ncbi:MAG: flavodoxin family protein [Deferribacteraceae bacterium]|jgi:multimeric flavodoxin WrbA|nr:flavodoxin family protein [Deferribacteraceae bacterium]
MTILIEASPNKNGNGTYLADKITTRYEEVTRIRLWDLLYRGCKGCRECKEKNTFCTQDDDIKGLFPKLADADRIVIIAPNYMGFISGELKQLIDRLYCMKDSDKRSRFKDSAKLVFLFTQGSPTRDHGDRAQQWIKSIADSYNLKYYGITIPNCAKDNTDAVRIKEDEIMMSLSFFS